MGDRDQFFLSRWLNFTIVSRTGGEGPVALNDLPLPGSMINSQAFAAGMIATTPNANARALSCVDQIRHVNFALAARGVTTGDVVNLFVQNATGTNVREVASFSIGNGSAQLLALRTAGTLHLNDRLAQTSSALAIKDTIPLATSGGAMGSRTQVLTLSLVNLLPDCLHLGLEIRRAGGSGATSVIFPDLLVERFEQAGNRNLQSGGVITGIYGPYPTGTVCTTVCVPCPPIGVQAARATFGFRNSLALAGLTSEAAELRLKVLRQAALWERMHNRDDLGTAARLRETFRLAQVIIFDTESLAREEAFAGSLQSYGYLKALPEAVVLQNGAVLAPDSTFSDLYQQTLWLLEESTRSPNNEALQADLLLVLALWEDLLGLQP